MLCDLACTVAEPVPVIMRPCLHGGRASPCRHATLPARWQSHIPCCHATLPARWQSHIPHCHATLPARWQSQSPSSCDLACTVVQRTVPVIVRPYLHGGRASPRRRATVPARWRSHIPRRHATLPARWRSHSPCCAAMPCHAMLTLCSVRGSCEHRRTWTSSLSTLTTATRAEGNGGPTHTASRSWVLKIAKACQRPSLRMCRATSRGGNAWVCKAPVVKQQWKQTRRSQSCAAPV